MQPLVDTAVDAVALKVVFAGIGVEGAFGRIVPEEGDLAVPGVGAENGSGRRLADLEIEGEYFLGCL